MKKLLPLLMIALIPLAGCKQELPKKLETPSVFGTVTEIRTQDSEKQLLYSQGQDPYQKNWGAAAGYYVTVEGKPYKLHWDQADKLKALKAGDKVNLHPTEYISCVGEADLKPTCTVLMRIYKSERRLEPLQLNK